MKNNVRTPIITVIFLLLVSMGACATDTNNLEDYMQRQVLAELIESDTPDYQLVDVRTPGEYAGGHIPSAVNIPVSEIEQQPPDVPKDRLVIVYCRSGARSGRAALWNLF
jgi:3-mercaptopyruvate sulfurtransferase SseA